MNDLLNDLLMINIFGKSVTESTKCYCLRKGHEMCTGRCIFSCTQFDIFSDTKSLIRNTAVNGGNDDKSWVKSDSCTQEEAAYNLHNDIRSIISNYDNSKHNSAIEYLNHVTNFLYMKENIGTTNINYRNILEFYGCKVKLKEESVMYKPGTYHADVLSMIDNDQLNKEVGDVFWYIKNTFLIFPENRYSDTENAIRNACQRIAAKCYNVSLLVLEFVGAEAFENTYTKTFLVCKVINPKNPQIYPYNAGGRAFVDFMVEALTLDEQRALLINLISIYNTEVCGDLKILQCKAILDRLLFEKNEYDPLINRCVVYYKSVLTGETKEIIELLAKNENFELRLEEACKTPIVLHSELEILLANNYVQEADYRKALPLFVKYGLTDAVILCLIKMKRLDEAILTINKGMEFIDGTSSTNYDMAIEYAKKVKVCRYLIQLASITGKIDNFDKAYRILPSVEPLVAKAKFLFDAGEYGKSSEAYKMALTHVPNNLEINFSYSCALVKSGQFTEAIAILDRLCRIEPKNVTFLKNTTFCYLKLGELEEGLSKLELAALYDSAAMEQYIWLSARNRLEPRILWAFSRTHYFEDLVDIYNHLIGEDTSYLKLQEAVKSNVKLKDYIKKFVDC